MSKKPKQRGLYAWNYLHAGSFLLFVEGLEHHYKFMFLPGPSEYCLTRKDFEDCIAKNILEFVEELPKDIFEESMQIFLSCPTKTPNMISYEKASD